MSRLECDLGKNRVQLLTLDGLDEMVVEADGPGPDSIVFLPTTDRRSPSAAPFLRRA